jgi:hypothetical protein
MLMSFRFSGALLPREHVPEKIAPTAQLTRIDADEQVFSVPLTGRMVAEMNVSGDGFCTAGR